MENGLDYVAAELTAEMENFVSELMMQPDREQVASEIGVLRSIYGNSAIHLWHGSRAGGPEYTSSGSSPNNGPDTIRYVVSLKYLFLSPIPLRHRSDSLPSHEDISIRILVSLPPSYPAESSPQLQLFSRYIGAFGVDSSLFGASLERCEAWYEDKLNREKVGELIREDVLGCDSAPQESAEVDKRGRRGIGKGTTTGTNSPECDAA
ncbi:hypothetical protein J3R83DRAFT_1189 [Lanmaoa asiatica]|nr:hypothetical protein J3R83DRAFT_1189 [Lanmaoa asiatica]